MCYLLHRIRFSFTLHHILHFKTDIQCILGHAIDTIKCTYLSTVQIFGILHQWYTLWQELRQLQPSGQQDTHWDTNHRLPQTLPPQDECITEIWQQWILTPFEDHIKCTYLSTVQIFGILHQWYTLWQELRQLQPSGQQDTHWDTNHRLPQTLPPQDKCITEIWQQWILTPFEDHIKCTYLSTVQIFGILHQWYTLWQELRQLQPSGQQDTHWDTNHRLPQTLPPQDECITEIWQQWILTPFEDHIKCTYLSTVQIFGILHQWYTLWQELRQLQPSGQQDTHWDTNHRLPQTLPPQDKCITEIWQQWILTPFEDHIKCTYLSTVQIFGILHQWYTLWQELRQLQPSGQQDTHWDTNHRLPQTLPPQDECITEIWQQWILTPFEDHIKCTYLSTVQIFGILHQWYTLWQELRQLQPSGQQDTH